jgi:hypothetical protein
MNCNQIISIKKVASILLITWAGLSLSACGESTEMQNVIKPKLKDPDSAKFGKHSVIATKSGATFACMTVNAKNSMGGYAGDKQATLYKGKNGWVHIGFLDMNQETCLQVVEQLQP